MNKQRLDEIRARAEEATKGPWEINSYTWNEKGNDGDWCGEIIGATDERVYGGAGCFHAINKMNNATFITHARQDIPDLLAYVEKLEAACREALEASELCGEVDEELLREVLDDG